MELLHFDGQIWRPPYEANSQLLQVTSGCTWRKCKFCSLYHGTDFRMSPMSEIEADLDVICRYQPEVRRVFLTGANPFALSYGRLFRLAELIRRRLPWCESVGMFARITDIRPKTVDELRNLRHLRIDNISIGTETGDDSVLARMNKGYTSSDIVEQCLKLEEAGIKYNLVYMTGLAGMGGCVAGAMRTAEVFNRLHPYIINIVSLTVFEQSELYAELRAGLFHEASERERLIELRTLIERLTVSATVLGNTVSNTLPVVGFLPADKARLLGEIDEAIGKWDEDDMRRYREGIVSL